MDKETRTIVMLISVLVLSFVTLGVLTHNLGFNQGLKALCDEEIGIDAKGNYVCYNATQPVFNVDNGVYITEVYK